MFDGGGDDVLMLREYMAARRKFVVLIERRKWPAHERVDYPEDGVVVGLGAAAGEDDFLGPRSDEGGDLLAGGFHRAAGTLTGSVDGSSVAKFLGEIGQHGVEHFWLDGSGGIEIEVDAVHGAIHRILPAGVSCLHQVGSEIAPRERSHRPARAPGKEQVPEAISS